jgi:riboflavin synthase
LVSRHDEAEWSNMVFRAPAALMRQMASKGSIAIEGVSLTLVDVTKETFSVALIPHTLAHTTLGELASGDTVNLETDLLAKYVQRQLETA